MSGKRLEIEGTLQGRVLVSLIEGAASGKDLMNKLNLSSSGTIYPVLKSLKIKGFIEPAPENVSGKKLYVLSNKGKEQLKIILLGISRRFFAHYVKSYVSFFVDEFADLIPVKPGQKVLCTLDYNSLKQWLTKTDTTYLQILEPPKTVYDLILCNSIGTMILYGWKIDEFTHYFSTLLNSLQSEGTLIMAEIEKTDNMFADMFFKEVLGYGNIGISKDELRELLESHNLTVHKIYSWKGLLIGFSTKSV